MERREQRRLSAILSADVVGYSRLMGRDERGTFAALKAHRAELVDPATAAHGGRIVKTTGDGMLVEFPSVVAAVECAVAIQNGMAERNIAVAEDDAVRFRIGIHLGDVIAEAGDIFGTGVNVAARLQEIADPGGITVSQSVYDHLDEAQAAAFMPGGEQKLKNISRPVATRQWRPADTDSTTPADGVAGSLSTRPSIAVLPFQVIAADPGRAFLAQGIAEDITFLSRLRWLSVISPESSFSYTRHVPGLAELGLTLGVTYVLQGSLRQAADHIRVTARLNDTRDGRMLWSERYDRDLADIFDVQDEISRRIAGEIEPELTAFGAQIERTKAPSQLNAWEHYQIGLSHLYAFDAVRLEGAERHMRRAVELDPESAAAWARLAYIFMEKFWYGRAEQHSASLDEAARLAHRAIELDGRDALGHLALGRVHSIRGPTDDGIAELRRAVQLSPSLAQAQFALGQAYFFTARPESANAPLQAAITLSPNDPHMWTFQMTQAMVMFLLGDTRQAENLARSSVRQPNAPHWAFAALGCLLGHLGKPEDARLAVAELRRLRPGYTRRLLRQDMPPNLASEIAAFFEGGLQKAGLPE